MRLIQFTCDICGDEADCHSLEDTGIDREDIDPDPPPICGDVTRCQDCGLWRCPACEEFCCDATT